MIDLTAVIVAGFGAIPGTLAAVLVYKVRKDVKVPSGGTIGAVVDNTHGLAGATAAHTTELVRAERNRTNGDTGEAV